MLFTITAFFIFFFSLFLMGLIILFIHNKRVKVTTARFLLQSKQLSPTLFPDIKIFYSTWDSLKYYGSPFNRGDVYLFDDFIVIIRRMNIGIKILYEPILISTNPESTKHSFKYVQTMKPDRITFSRFSKRDIGIEMTDSIYRHRKIELILKGLTNDEIAQLERMNWNKTAG